MKYRHFLYIVIFSFCMMMVYLLSGILTPFVLGGLLAYLGDPCVNCMERFKIPRTLGVVFVFTVVIFAIVASIFVLMPIIQRELMELASKMPAIVDWIQLNIMPSLKEHFGVNETFDFSTIKDQFSGNIAKAGGLAKMLIDTVTNSGFALIMFFTNMVLMMIVAFYLMRDWRCVLRAVQCLFPGKSKECAISIATDCDVVIGAFIKGQLLVMFALALTYSFGLWVVGLNVALLIGLISGLVAVVPYLGFFVGIVVASVAAYFQFHDISHIMYVWIVYTVGITLENAVYTPLFVGKKVGMHPVTVIFAILAGGELFGFLGIMLAVPIASVVMVLARYLRKYCMELEAVK